MLQFQYTTILGNFLPNKLWNYDIESNILAFPGINHLHYLWKNGADKDDHAIHAAIETAWISEIKKISITTKTA